MLNEKGGGKFLPPPKVLQVGRLVYSPSASTMNCNVMALFAAQLALPACVSWIVQVPGPMTPTVIVPAAVDTSEQTAEEPADTFRVTGRKLTPLFMVAVDVAV